MTASPETRAVLDALHRHYSDGKWATVEEVARIDLLAVGVWRSTGYRWHGYEVKVSRSDWLRELRKPGKAQDRLCHAWTVATPPGVLRPGELPDGWGHVVVRDGRVHQQTRPIYKPSPVQQLDGTDGALLALEVHVAHALVARRARYAEADARALVQAWPGTREELVAALRTSMRGTGRLLPGIGVYGQPEQP